jgi:hypothetical protein
MVRDLENGGCLGAPNPHVRTLAFNPTSYMDVMIRRTGGQISAFLTQGRDLNGRSPSVRAPQLEEGSGGPRTQCIILV